MPTMTLQATEIDDDFAGFDSLEDWENYDRFRNDDAVLREPSPIDPEMEKILSTLEAAWHSPM